MMNAILNIKMTTVNQNLHLFTSMNTIKIETYSIHHFLT